MSHALPQPTRIAAPTLPATTPRQGFPIVASAAPVLMSVVLWLVTRSPYTLVFAALGPVVAIATMADSRFGARRRRRAESLRFASELEAAQREVATAHASELERLHAVAPSAHDLAAGPQHERWGGAAPDSVRLGLANRSSGVAVEGTSDQRGEDPALAALRSLRAEAAVLRGAPVSAPIGIGVGVVGPPVEASAVARAILLQVLAFHSPANYAVRGGEDWIARGPHAWHPGNPHVVEIADAGFADTQTTITIASAREPSALPRHLATVVLVEGGRASLVGDPSVFTPESVSVEQAVCWADGARRVAERSGAVAVRTALPERVDFGELRQPVTGVGLGSAIGMGANGPVIVDLVGDGPHAVVGGMTGSGKSELLVTWLLAIASTRSPAEANFLLFDFKGGSSFGAIPPLPHCVGLVTDLDPVGAARAIESLSAELRHRERVLAAAGVRSIEHLPSLARLIIVVDEFAAMASDFPELHALFADVAARGRSLGVHLVLSTQRPSGVVRDAVLANASLRVSLRVNNRPDSVALIGTDAAAGVGNTSGRAWVAHVGLEVEAVQVAIATTADVERAAASWGIDWRPRRPWLDPLPRVLDSIPPGALGLIDLPEEQSQPPLHWDPDRDGSLLVIGGARSGKSNILALIDDERVPFGVEEAWDAVHSPDSLLLVDDVDLLVGQFPGEYQQAFLDRLAAAMRSGTRAVLTTQRMTASVQQLAALCDSRILLRMPSKQEHVIAGGSGESFAQDLPAGAGHWRGARVQLALASPRSSPPPRRANERFDGTGSTIAISPRPRALAARLTDAGIRLSTDPTLAGGVFVTDPDNWLAGALRYAPLLRERALLLHECSVLEYRQVTRRRDLPPPIADPVSTAWLLEPESEPRRVRI